MCQLPDQHLEREQQANRRSCCGTQLYTKHKDDCTQYGLAASRSTPDAIPYSTERQISVAPSEADPGLHPEHYVNVIPSAVSDNRLRFSISSPYTQQGYRCLEIALEALELFVTKNNGYGEPDEDDLGARGQYADMHRKWKRIRKHLWDGQPWEGSESFEEVLMDFIGHILLTIDFDRQGRAQ